VQEKTAKEFGETFWESGPKRRVEQKKENQNYHGETHPRKRDSKVRRGWPMGTLNQREGLLKPSNPGIKSLTYPRTSF